MKTQKSITPRKPRSGAPESARRAAAADDGPGHVSADDIKNAMERNGVGNGKSGTLPPPDAHKALESLPSATQDQILKGPKPKAKTKKAKANQDLLPGMPTPDGVAKCADAFREIIEGIADLTEQKADAEAKLIKSLQDHKRKGIQVAGYNFDLNVRTAKVSIKVHKPKGK